MIELKEVKDLDRLMDVIRKTGLNENKKISIKCKSYGEVYIYDCERVESISHNIMADRLEIVFTD